MVVASPVSLWIPLFRQAVGYDHLILGSLAFFSSIPIFLGLLWAFLSDRVPLFGTRREGYLVVAGVISTVGWALAPFVPAVFGGWILVGLPLNLGSAVTTTAAHGALADHGRRLAATGTMAAGLIGGANAVGLLAIPLKSLPESLGRTAFVGALLGLATVGAAFLLLRRAPPISAAHDRERLFRYLCSRRFWSVVVLG